MTASDPKAADAVLFQLKSLGAAQAETVAQRLKITVQAVRQRLDRLLAENLVEFGDQQRGRGRPRRFWSLTPQAMSLLSDTHGQLARLLQKRAGEITANYRSRLGGERDMAAKLAVLAEIRPAEGYMARIEELPDGGYLLIEDHLPICAAATACQGFCSIELFRPLFNRGWQIERQDHLLSGARRCTYRVVPERSRPRADSSGLVLTIPPIVPPESPHRR